MVLFEKNTPCLEITYFFIFVFKPRAVHVVSFLKVAMTASSDQKRLYTHISKITHILSIRNRHVVIFIEAFIMSL